MVKYWASQCGVSGASQGNLSPYAVTLMVIYFLQVYSIEDGGAGTLPVLTEHDESQKDKWKPWQSLRKVLGAFFMFYGGLLPNSFDWSNEVVSIRLGQRKKKDDEAFAKLYKRPEIGMHIEDPIEVQRNLHDVLKQDREQALFQALHHYGGSPLWFWDPMAPQFNADIMSTFAAANLWVQAQQQLRQPAHRRPPGPRAS
eukprot:630139-Amphidinium_carterae.1